MTKPMTEKLLNCPFCGGEAELEEVKMGDVSNWTVGCREDVDEMPMCMGYQSLTQFARKCEAITAWNTRPLAMVPGGGGWELVRSLLSALEDARQQLEGYEYEATGEVYNSPSLNAAILEARAALPAAPQADGVGMSRVSDLIERVERATGADRELDAELAWALLDQDWSSGPERAVSEPLSRILLLPAYTGSVDDALALIERVRPGWDYRVERNGSLHSAAVWKSGTYIGGYGAEDAPTPALALCLALLRAMETA